MKALAIGAGLTLLIGLYVAHRWMEEIYRCNNPEDYDPKTGKWNR